MIIVILIMLLIIAAQPSIYVEQADAEDCAHVEIVRFDILRKIDPKIPVPVIMDTVICDGETVDLNGRTISAKDAQ